MALIEKRIRLEEDDWDVLELIRGMTGGLSLSMAVRACTREAFPVITRWYERQEHQVKQANAKFEGAE
jgi:hypothetical protein